MTKSGSAARQGARFIASKHERKSPAFAAGRCRGKQRSLGLGRHHVIAAVGIAMLRFDPGQFRETIEQRG
jgi:hypothetical protein